MNTRFFGTIGIATLLIFQSCSSSESTDSEGQDETVQITEKVDTSGFLESLKELEDRISKAPGIPNEEDLKEALTTYQDYAAIFPEDEKAPDYLLKASDIALTIDQPEKSVKLLSKIITEYPDYKRMEDVKYNKASHLDFELRDTTKAKEAYQEFIETYPESPLVNDCKARIENIRFSLEELLEQFEKNLNENS